MSKQSEDDDFIGLKPWQQDLLMVGAVLLWIFIIGYIPVWSEFVVVAQVFYWVGRVMVLIHS